MYFLFSTFVLGKFTWIWWRRGIGVSGMRRLQGQGCWGIDSAAPAFGSLRRRMPPTSSSYIHSPRVGKGGQELSTNCSQLCLITQNYMSILITDIIDIYCVTKLVSCLHIQWNIVIFVFLLTGLVRGWPSKTVYAFIINWNDSKNYKCLLMHR